MKSYCIKDEEKLTKVWFIPPNINDDKIIPKGVKVIGKQAFAGVSALSSIIIPEGVEKIEEGAFYRCSNLRSVVLPKSLLWVDDGAFADCTSLEFIHYEMNTVFGNFCFSNCPKLIFVEQDKTQARTFYFPRHNQFAITIEQPQLSTEQYTVYQGRFSDFDFPTGEADVSKPLIFFAETKDHKNIWYDIHVEDAITGCLFQASGKSAADFFQKEFTLDTEITPRQFSLLTGVCYEGRSFGVKVLHGTDNSYYRIGDLVVTLQNYAPKVADRFTYLLAHQHEYVRLLNLENGLQWGDALKGGPFQKTNNQN